MITLRTLGPVEVLVRGGPAPPELLWRKHLALLVYLARSPDHVRSREHLTGLLWGEKPESAARHSLNEGLRILRRCCGDGAITTTGGHVRLGADAFELDTDALMLHAGRSEWAEAAALVSGEFMEGFSVPGEWGFEEWLSGERRLWTRRSVEALVSHAHSRLAAGGTGDAASVAAWALRLEPASEPACRTLLRARSLLGDRAGALAVYEDFRTRLQDDLGIAPSDETAVLAERIAAERALRVPGHAATPAAGAESRRAPLVERDAAMASVLRAWEACRSGEGAHVAILDGEPGCGLTRMVQETVDRARLDGALSAVLRAVEGDRCTPWSGLVGLLRSGLSSAEGADRAPPAARAALAELLTAAGRGEDRPVEHGSAGAAFSELLRAMTAVHPAILAVDDAHWLDPESLHALGAALRDLDTAPFFVLFAVPTHQVPVEIDAMRARIGRDLRGESVHLPPLSGAGLRALAGWALPGYQSVEIDRVARRLATDTAGLPLLAIELLHAIALGLDLSTGGGAWPAPFRTLDQTMPADLPDTITAAIRVGFRRLSAEARTVLQAASVLRPRVKPETLARATSLDESTVASALDELEWGRWLHAEPRGYAFVARIVREVVARDMVTGGQRRRFINDAGSA